MSDSKYRRSVDNRDDYFRFDRDIQPPFNPQLRLDKARAYLAQEAPDYEAAFMLYDDEIDNENADWLHLMGKVHSDEASMFYNLDYGEAFYDASFKLGADNVYIDRDTFYYARMERRLRAYFAEHDLGDPPQSSEDRRAKFEQFIYQIPPRFDHAYRLFDPYLDNTNDSWIKLISSTYNFTTTITSDNIAQNVADNIILFPQYLTSYTLTWNIIKQWKEGNRELAYSYVTLLAPDSEIEADLGATSLSIIAETILEGNFDNLYFAAVDFLQRLDKTKIFCPCNACDVKINATNAIISEVEPADLRRISQIIQPLLKNKDDLHNLYSRSVENGTDKLISDVLFLQSSASSQNLCSDEQSRLKDTWVFLSDSWQVLSAGIDPNVVRQQTINYGASYNTFSEDGLPVVGEYNNIFQGGPNHEKEIESGPGYLEKIMGDEQGNISFEFSNNPYALIFEEDIEALLVLSFCYDKHKFPSIDVSSAKSDNDALSLIRKKIPDPLWLLHTELGRTLYTTDVWAGELSWRINHFAETPDLPNSNVEDFRRIRQKLNSIPPNDGSFGPLIVNVNLKDIKFYKPKEVFIENSKATEIVPRRQVIGIDGGYQTDDDTWHFRNSSAHPHTQRTLTLTEHYNDIASIFPVYERLRQLMSISYGLKVLKRTDFVPSDEKMAQLFACKQKFEDRLEKLGDREYAFRFPIKAKPKGPA